MKGSILGIGQCTSQWYAHHSQNSFHLSILSLSTRDSCVGMFLGLLWSSLQFNIQIYKHRWPVHNFSSHMGQQLCLGNRGLTSHFRITSRTLWPSCRILCNVGRTSGRGGQVVDGGDSWEPQSAMCWLGIGKRYTCTLPNLSKILDVSEEKTDGQIDHLQVGGWRPNWILYPCDIKTHQDALIWWIHCPVCNIFAWNASVASLHKFAPWDPLVTRGGAVTRWMLDAWH